MTYNNIQHGKTLHNILIGTITGRHHHSMITITDINIIIYAIMVGNRVTVIKATIPKIHNRTTEAAHHAETVNPTEKLEFTGI